MKQGANTGMLLSYLDHSEALGVKVNNQATSWKVYGPDKDGTFGGLNGIGGLEAIVTPTKTYSIVNDALGHVVATHDGTEIKRVPTQVGSYGLLPGSFSLPLSPERGLHEVTHWQGRRQDETGFINMGRRPYRPDSGDFPSADPYSHAGSWDLHSFALGNPAVFCDPTGRIATGFHHGAIKGDYYEASNTAQGIGKFVGQVGMGFVPYFGQAADIRDIPAAWNVGRTQGWSFGTSANLAMAGVALIPGMDVVKAGVKPLFKTTPTSAVADVAKNVEMPNSQTTILGAILLN